MIYCFPPLGPPLLLNYPLSTFPPASLAYKFLPCWHIQSLSRHCPVAGHAPALHVRREDARSVLLVDLAQTALVAPLEVDVLEVEGVDVAGEIAVEASSQCCTLPKFG